MACETRDEHYDPCVNVVLNQRSVTEAYIEFYQSEIENHQNRYDDLDCTIPESLDEFQKVYRDYRTADEENGYYISVIMENTHTLGCK